MPKNSAMPPVVEEVVLPDRDLDVDVDVDADVDVDIDAGGRASIRLLVSWRLAAVASVAVLEVSCFRIADNKLAAGLGGDFEVADDVEGKEAEDKVVEVAKVGDLNVGGDFCSAPPTAEGEGKRGGGRAELNIDDAGATMAATGVAIIAIDAAAAADVAVFCCRLAGVAVAETDDATG
jgi:hypothetical protein